jgi:hypothetical protein
MQGVIDMQGVRTLTPISNGKDCTCIVFVINSAALAIFFLSFEHNLWSVCTAQIFWMFLKRQGSNSLN